MEEIREENYLMRKEGMHPFWLMLIRVAVYFIGATIVNLLLSYFLFPFGGRIVMFCTIIANFILLAGLETYFSQKLIVRQDQDLNVLESKDEFILKDRFQKYFLFYSILTAGFVFSISMEKPILFIFIMLILQGYYIELYLDNRADFVKKGDVIDKSWKKTILFQQAYKFFPDKIKRNFFSGVCGFIGRICRLFVTVNIVALFIAMIWSSVPSIRPENLGLFLYRIQFYGDAIPYLQHGCIEKESKAACAALDDLAEMGLILKREIPAK